MALDDPMAGSPFLAPFSLDDAQEELFRQYVTGQPSAAPPLPMPAIGPDLTATGSGGTEVAPPIANAMPPFAEPLPEADPLPAPMPVTDPVPAAPAPTPDLRLVPDAVSGGTTAEQAEDIARVEQTGAPVARALGTTGEPLPAPDDYLTDDELKDRAASESAEAFAKRQLDHAAALKDFTTGRQAEEARRFAERAEQDYADFITARDEARADGELIAAEAKELANAKIDNNKWWADRSTGQKISAFISAIAGGLAAPYNGGRNDGLAMIQGAIDRDIETQKANLANRRAALGERQRSHAERLGMVNEDYRTVQRYRIASYERAINQIAADAQRFDPRGSTAIAYGQMIRELRASQAKALADYQQTALKNKLDISKAVREERDLDEKIRHQKRQDQLDAWRISQADRQHKDRLAMDEKKLSVEADKIAAEGNAKLAKLIREQGVAAPPTVIKNADGSVTQSHDLLRNADGQPWIVPTTEEARDFRKKKAAADSIVGILDEMREIRDGVGGESSWGNSPEYGRLQVLKQNLVLLKKAGTEGMSSDADMQRIELALGADSPASFRAQAAKLDAGRAQVEKQLNTAAQNLGYSGKRITYTDPLKNRKPKTPEQKQIEEVISFDSKRSMTIDELARDVGVDPATVTSGGNVNYPALANAAQQKLRDEHGGVPPSVKARIDALRAAQNDPDPKKAATANEALATIAAEAEDPNVRAYARANAINLPAPASELP